MSVSSQMKNKKNKKKCNRFILFNIYHIKKKKKKTWSIKIDNNIQFTTDYDSEQIFLF
jgi:hypothetical protein